MLVIREESDGFITESSAASMPNATYPPQLMLGSSHFQMRNDFNAQIAFRKLLDKDIGGLQFQWFKSN